MAFPAAAKSAPMHIPFSGNRNTHAADTPEPHLHLTPLHVPSLSGYILPASLRTACPSPDTVLFRHAGVTYGKHGPEPYPYNSTGTRSCFFLPKYTLHRFGKYDKIGLYRLYAVPAAGSDMPCNPEALKNQTVTCKGENNAQENHRRPARRIRYHVCRRCSQCAICRPQPDRIVQQRRRRPEKSGR